MDVSKLNPYFQQLAIDYLYHLGLDSSMDLHQQFGNIKYVVLTRSFANADHFAQQFAQAYYQLIEVNITCHPIGKQERFHLYKIANTLIISHGVGAPSLLICLNEVVKLLWHAQAKDYQFIRFSPGTGLNVPANSIIVAHQVYNQQLHPEWLSIEFGQYHTYSTLLKSTLSQAIIAANLQIPLLSGAILASTSFYSGQARLNGALAVNYNQAERDDYLQLMRQLNICGIDLESDCFAAFCSYVQIPAAIVLAVINNPSCYDQEPVLAHDAELAPLLQHTVQAIINYILTTSAIK